MFYLCRAALEHMQPGATIVNTSSDEAYHPLPQLLDYAVTKGAIANFARGLAQETIGRGIRVNAVAPGPVWTPILPVSVPPEQVSQIGSTETPMGRPGQPAEIAPAFVFLASQESSNVNAEVLGATGGTPLPRARAPERVRSGAPPRYSPRRGRRRAAGTPRSSGCASSPGLGRRRPCRGRSWRRSSACWPRSAGCSGTGRGGRCEIGLAVAHAASPKRGLADSPGLRGRRDRLVPLPSLARPPAARLRADRRGRRAGGERRKKGQAGDRDARAVAWDGGAAGRHSRRGRHAGDGRVAVQPATPDTGRKLGGARGCLAEPGIG